jgi:rod shape-determining protein MreC
MKSLPSKSEQPRLRTFAAYLVVSLALLLLPSGWTGRARLAAVFPVHLLQGAWLGVLSPAEGWADRIGILWGDAGEVRELRKKNAALKAQLAWESEWRHAQELRLRQLDELPAESQGFRPVGARILSYDASALRRTAVLNRGAGAGVTPNAPVLWNGALIGRVDSVGPWSCSVVLVGDRQCSIGVRCARTRVQGVLKSAGGGVAQVDDIAAQADIRAGDLFVTSGMDGVFPPGLFVGECAEASGESGAIFQWVVVKPAFDPALLEDAVILLPEPAPN